MDSAASARRRPTPAPTSAPTPRSRRCGRLLPVLLTLLGLVVGAVVALRRRRPAMPAWIEQERPQPSPAPRAAPTPVQPATQAPDPTPTPEPEPSAVPAPAPDPAPLEVASPQATPTPQPVPQPTPAPPGGGARPGRAVAELTRVSGLGRRSAEALVVAGITSLDDLADADDARLGAAMDAAGVRRSATMSTWASQARRLTGIDATSPETSATEDRPGPA